MTELPDVQPLTHITDKDLRQAFLDLTPGWYTSADLLPRYNAWAKSRDKPEVTAKTLGESISREFRGNVTRKYVTGHRRAWWLDEPTLTHRNWFKRPDSAPST